MVDEFGVQIFLNSNQIASGIDAESLNAFNAMFIPLYNQFKETNTRYASYIENRTSYINRALESIHYNETRFNPYKRKGFNGFTGVVTSTFLQQIPSLRTSSMPLGVDDFSSEYNAKSSAYEDLNEMQRSKFDEQKFESFLDAIGPENVGNFLLFTDLKALGIGAVNIINRYLKKHGAKIKY